MSLGERNSGPQGFSLEEPLATGSIAVVPVPAFAGLPIYWKSLCIVSIPIKIDVFRNATLKLYGENEFNSILYSARFIVNIGQWERVDEQRWKNSFLLDGSFPAQTTTSKRKGSSFLSAPISSLLNTDSHSRFHNFITIILEMSSLEQQPQCLM